MATAPFIANQNQARPSANSPLEAAESAVAAAVLELLPRNEFVIASDPAWVEGLISFYNALFRIGFKAMMTLVVILLLVFAPFVGMFSAGWSFMAAIFRQGAIQVGRGVSDSLGYGAIVRTKASYVAWKRGLIRPSLVHPLPPEGIKASSRTETLKQSELGFLPSPEELFYGRTDSAAGVMPGTASNTCVTAPIRWFNAAFSFGFLAGTVLLAVASLVFAPFVGAFISLGSLGYSLLRTFSRAEGRLVLDVLGVSELVSQEMALMQEEMTLNPAATNSNNNAGAAGNGGGMPQAAVATYNPIPMAMAVPSLSADPSNPNPNGFYPQMPATYQG